MMRQQPTWTTSPTMTSISDLPMSVAIPSLIVGFSLAWLFGYKVWRNARLFPGPIGLPLLGNVHQIPLVSQHTTFAEWEKRYGSIIYVRILQRPVLFLNSVEAANDLMDTKGANYSDRPPLVFLRESLGLGIITPLLPYGAQWRRHRKWMQTALLDKRALDSYREMQIKQVRRLLWELIQSPEDFETHIKRYVGAFVLRITYGRTSGSSQDEEFIKMAAQAVADATGAGNLGAALIDFIPMLRYLPAWMPGAGFQRKALRIKHSIRNAMEIPYKSAKEAVVPGTEKACFVTSVLQQLRQTGELTEEDENDLVAAAGGLFLAGIETSITVLLAFVLAMVLHPEVCKKAQAEIDSAIGLTRLPDFGDRASLPYVERMLQELLRWSCPVTLGVPHQSIADDEYLGRHIPGGTMIVPNIWSMTRNPHPYPDPETFRPERFDELDATTLDLHDPSKLVFGFGRRICPGRYLADSTIWLVMVSILACFDISKAVDEEGNEITPTASFDSAAVRHTKPFKCKISPRSHFNVEHLAV
ncbi:cytochrome P450 [Laetiporus sulphureus 93-53]|uniref:Cytochrome P450 n=1 Tax=Laetiporus sulphureus 93-53 TaxID=1314785 RepID=A0A165I611_9APHY|nr:cytochrome P450 [Laetiporus sulphureus 93-53]KZT12638.1 cytochrome P450 [Laetiporus sulphureus 93-53]